MVWCGEQRRRFIKPTGWFSESCWLAAGRRFVFELLTCPISATLHVNHIEHVSQARNRYWCERVSAFLSSPNMNYQVSCSGITESCLRDTNLQSRMPRSPLFSTPRPMGLESNLVPNSMGFLEITLTTVQHSVVTSHSLHVFDWHAPILALFKSTISTSSIACLRSTLAIPAVVVSFG